MMLTGKEILDLAGAIGLTVQDADKDILEGEYRILGCSPLGVKDDNGTYRHYNYVMICDEMDGDECYPLGDELEDKS